MEINEHSRPFWKTKASQVVTYNVVGQENDLYMTQKKGEPDPILMQNKKENFYPKFKSYDVKQGSVQINDGYIVKKGYSPPRKVKIIQNSE
jgi:hypothetical protein